LNGSNLPSGSAQASRRFRLDGATAVVTGGGGAIGSATGRILAAAGSAVVLVDLNSENLEQAASTIRAEGGEVSLMAADLSSPGVVNKVVEQALSLRGRLDVLVNNAGISPVTPFLEIPLEEWRRVFAINVEVPLALTQAIAKVMIGQEVSEALRCRGKIINISSKAADVGRPLLASYGATKAALNHLTMTTADVLAEHLIASTIFYPGGVAEGLLGQVAPMMAAAEGQGTEQFLDSRANLTALGRASTPDEMAAHILYIAASKGMRLNGQRVWGFTPEDALAR
jgi:meso-butanediol dehydrogenase/(S,S)-butanediol dehydrogenase/diacetyl reductase